MRALNFLYMPVYPRHLSKILFLYIIFNVHSHLLLKMSVTSTKTFSSL
jgi:hypothetical protein